MSGSHYAPPPDESTRYDLRTLSEHEADDLAALRLEVQQEREARQYANRRVADLERRVNALEDAASRHADALTVIQLREGL